MERTVLPDPAAFGWSEAGASVQRISRDFANGKPEGAQAPIMDS